MAQPPGTPGGGQCGCSGMPAAMQGMPMSFPMAMPGVPMMGMGMPMVGMGMPMMGMGMPMMGMGMNMGMPTMGMNMGMPMMGGMGMNMGMPTMGMTVALPPGSGAAQAAQLAQTAQYFDRPSEDVQPPKPAAPLPTPTPPERPAELRSSSAAGSESAGDSKVASEEALPAAAAVAAGEAAAEDEDRAEAPVEQRPPTCHLHVKPSPKCKFCQRAGQAAQKAAASTAQAAATSGGAPTRRSGRSAEDYTRRVFNCSPMLKDQIMQSRYFKTLLTSISTLEDLIEEIAKFADTLDVYSAASTTAPSCFICQVYRLFTLPYAEDLGELQALIDHGESPEVRCAGFLYMRFVVNPANLWDKVEEYLFDEMPLQYMENGRQVESTIGGYVEGLLVKDKYFGTPLPRVPVKVRQALDLELAPLPQFRKRMEANRRAFQEKPIHGRLVEVYLEGRWVPGKAKDFVGRAATARKIRIVLEGSEENEGGQLIAAHLGRVVLRDSDGEGSGSAESGSEDSKDSKAKRRNRSRSRRRRGGSPDWSRWKGDGDAGLIQELRERAREEAVFSGRGKFYAKRPQSVEQQLWQNTNSDARVSHLGDYDHTHVAKRAPHGEGPDAAGPAQTTRSREEQDAYQKRMKEIYEKYGSANKAASSTTSVELLDKPDVLRLG